MGVPSFYRWLVGRYPKTVVNAIDEDDGCASDANPNGEFDNFYLDMNGIIHPCFHPDDELFTPSTFDEVFVAIFEYIDRLIRIVRPRKLLYMAVDGVAPRAKMNQQRARRFRSAKDAEISEYEEHRLRREFESEGKELLPIQEYSEVSDSNVITPGTVFMQKLSKALEYYIRVKLNTDPFWKSIMVILSDANVPGEGEHKIMSFIRLQRRLSGYNPNTRHCLHGLDADLIMLALATHEIHFCILREDVLKQGQNEICLSALVSNSSQKDLDTFKSRQWFKKFETIGDRRINKTSYQFLNIWILREYLELDMKPRFDADMERIVDDFIFICFFTGNDFLPHLPSIEIHENGIDLLIYVYKKMFKFMGDYLVDTSNINKKNTAYINFKGLRNFIVEVGLYENRIFEKRHVLKQKKLQRLLKERENDENDDFNVMQDNFNSFSKKCNTSSSQAVEDSCSAQSDALQNTKELRRKLKQFLRDKADLFKNEVLENDKIKLGCPGWKARYYEEKFSAENTKVEAIRKLLVKKYVEGLCWVLQYYFTGICSWSWYYPFYYAPFASDFKDLCFVEVSFAFGRPFKPFDQLMAVLPSRSSHALPEAYRSLMNDDNSPIINFYPKDFAVDNHGKRFAWQGICKLPFIEEEILLGATKVLLKELQPDEMERNCDSSDKVFAMDSNSLIKKINPQHKVSENHPKEAQNHDAVVPSFEINGCLSFCEGNSTLSKFASPVLGMEDISNDRSRCATFIKQEPQAHIPRPLDCVEIPEKTITDADIVDRMLWHEYSGHFPPQPLRQRDVQTLPASANGTPRGAREDSVVERSLAGPGEETRKGAGGSWGVVGRGKLAADRSFVGSGKETWKGAGAGWGGVGRGKLADDRIRAVPSQERNQSYSTFPAAHLNRNANRSNTNAYGRGEYSAATPPVTTSKFDGNLYHMDERSMANRYDNWSQEQNQSYSTFPATHLNRNTNRSNTNAYGRGEYSAATPVTTSKFDGNLYHMDERSMANRSDNWRQRAAPVVSVYGRGRGSVRPPPSNSYGSRGGGNQNFSWVRRKSEQIDASMDVSSGLKNDGGDGGKGKGRAD